MPANGVISGDFPSAEARYYFALDVVPGDLMTQLSFAGREGAPKEVELEILDSSARASAQYWIHGEDASLQSTRGFLNFELERCARGPVCLSRMVDTLVLARSKHPGAKHSLDALCARFGVDRSMRVRHGALLDAQLLAQVYVELTGGRQIGLSLGIVPAKAGAESAAASPAQRIVRPPRPHAPSDEERTRHRSFIERLTSPLWERYLVPV